jgi:FMN-dependent NADH-azoreductase
MNVLFLSCSPRGQASESQRLAQTIVDKLVEREPGINVVHRDLGAGTLSHVDGPYATHLGERRNASGPLSGDGSLGESEHLIKELEDADYVVVGTPMHNFTVPSSLKAWIDHVVRVRRTFHVTPQGKVGALRDRPVFVAVSSGGRYTGEGARQPDFLTPYLKAIFATIGLHSVWFFSIESLASGADALTEGRQSAQRAVADFFATMPVA